MPWSKLNRLPMVLGALVLTACKQMPAIPLTTPKPLEVNLNMRLDIYQYRGDEPLDKEAAKSASEATQRLRKAWPKMRVMVLSMHQNEEYVRQALRNGWKLPDSYAGYAFLSYDCEPLATKHVSAADVLRFRDAAFQTYFTNPDYLALVERKFGAPQRANVEDMTKIRLKRRLLGD